MILAVVQVRMGSTRLPGKVLMDVMGKPMLWQLIKRIEHAKLVDSIAIATTSEPKDKPIRDFAEEYGIDHYAGSENDLVDRLYQTAKKFGAEAIVRITGDCPLAEPEIIDQLVDYYRKNKGEVDYISNTIPKRTYPDGLDTELYPFTTLERLWKEAKTPFLREWVHTYITDNPDKFRLVNLLYAKDLSAMRWTVDYKEDLELVREIFKALYKPGEVFHMEDILEFLEKNPQLADLNKEYVCNAAYAAALKEREKQEGKK